MHKYNVRVNAEKIVMVEADHAYIENETLTFYSGGKLVAAFHGWVSFTLCVGEVKND